ncbi:MAG: DNA repair protein RecN [Prevotellaceae bacterium]|nr:DNA repair protein RecN [Candidatus Minthosoma caballi]
MLKNLHIENYALIEQLDMDLYSGFSVITGETGAGKSIILGAIGLLLGQRADSKSIKAGAKKCVIEAVFDVEGDEQLAALLAENDFNDDEGGRKCIIRRELTAAGKSRAFINDIPASLAQLKEVGEMLIDVHSQHKNLLLGKEDFQLGILDVIAGNAELLESYKSEYKQYKLLCKQLEEAIEELKNGRDDEDYLRFQADQLAEADLTDGEQEELEEESETLEHAEEIKTALYGALGNLQSDEGMDAVQMVRQSISQLNGIASVFANADELSNRLDSCYIELKDIASEIESQAEDVEYNPQRLEQVNDRLNTIYTLQKKHNVDTVAELLEVQKDLEDKLARIDNSDEYVEELRKQKDAQCEKANKVAKQLSKARKKAAAEVEKAMIDKLLPLGMPNVRFGVEFGETELSANGVDAVQFLFNANKSGEMKPVSQIASGGEIARVMLSLKALVAGAVKLPTIIFDEIDTGVSGSIAEKMAKIMQEMGEQNRQVISITHLPQIAAMGSHHYKVYKEDNDEATVSHIVELSYDERITELAHMLSGETLTQAALDNAKELMG